VSFLSWLRGDERAIDASDFNIGDPMFTSTTDSGTTVDQHTALTLVPVYACVTLISDTISSLPVDLFRRQGDARVAVPRTPTWLEGPNPEMSWREFVDRALHSLLLYGNAFVVITARDNLGFPAELYVVPPDEVTVRRDGNRKVFSHSSGRVFTPYTASRPDGEMLQVMGHSADGLAGMSPIDQARQAIGLGLAQEKFGAKFFGQGTQASGVVEMPQGSVPTQDQLAQMGMEFRRKYSGVENAWKPIVLGNGATWKPITIPNDQAQFLESRRFSVAEIARLYRVPPHLIGDVERSTSWGSGIEEQNIGFVTYTLNPWITRLEDKLSQLTPRGQFLKWNVNGLLRGDVAARYQSYQVGITNGFISRNEARAHEDLAPVDGLDDFLIPVNTSQPMEQTA